MKFQVTILFFFIAAVAGFSIDSSFKVDRQFAKDFLETKFLNKWQELNLAEQKCTSDILNITGIPQGLSSSSNLDRISFIDAHKLDYVYGLILSTYCNINEVPVNANDFRESMGQMEEIQCGKLVLSHFRPQSEILRNFNATKALSLGCGDPSEMDSSEISNVKESLNSLQIKKCSVEDFFYVKDMDIDILEFELMMVATSDEVSDEKLLEKAKKTQESLKKYAKHQIDCIMSEYEECEIF